MIPSEFQTALSSQIERYRVSHLCIREDQNLLITVVDNLPSVFEDTVKTQFASWAQHLIPDWQFGFVPDCGTTDYGVALSFNSHDSRLS